MSVADLKTKLWKKFRAARNKEHSAERDSRHDTARYQAGRASVLAEMIVEMERLEEEERASKSRFEIDFGSDVIGLVGRWFRTRGVKFLIEFTHADYLQSSPGERERIEVKMTAYRMRPKIERVLDQ